MAAFRGLPTRIRLNGSNRPNRVVCQSLPERVLRDFSRHRDARSLDRYSKPRATRRAIVRAFGPSLGPGAQSAATTEPTSDEVPRK